MSLKLKLIPRHAFEVIAPDGTSLGEFKQVGDEWEGMLKLVASGSGEALVVDRGNRLGGFFDSVFGSGEIHAEVIKLSPSLSIALDKIEKKVRTAAPAPAGGGPTPVDTS